MCQIASEFAYVASSCSSVGSTFHTLEANYQPQGASFKQSARRILVANLNRLACSNPAQGTVLLDSFGARVGRERYAREHYAAYRHGRAIRVCRRPPAASNIDCANWHAATAALLCIVSMAAELRESVTRNTATLLVAQMTAPDSVSNKRKRTLSQRGGVLQCAKPFSVLHSHSQFAIPWPSRTGSGSLHDASGFVLSRICFASLREPIPDRNSTSRLTTLTS